MAKGRWNRTPVTNSWPHLSHAVATDRTQKSFERLAEHSANLKKRICNLPTLRQTIKKEFGTCRRFGKRQKNILRLADNRANDKKIFWDLPTFGQTSKKKFWDLPKAGQTIKKEFETCPKLGKRQKKNLRLAQSWAKAKKRFWDLPNLGQGHKKDFKRNSFGKTDGTTLILNITRWINCWT